jgi:phosphoglycerate-specific signal transduction histidine kinase
MTVCTAGYHNGMRQLLVSVEEQDWERLQQVAQRANCTAEELIARILRHLLQRVNPPTQEWQQRFDTLLQQVHRHTAQFSPEEIEADITDAWREYRSECGS